MTQRAAIHQRQDGEGAARQKMFEGAATMRTLMPDRRDDAHLRIGASDPTDPRGLAQSRTRSIRGHQQGGDGPAPVGQGDGDAGTPRLCMADADRFQDNAAGSRCREQGFHQELRFDHVREGLAGLRSVIGAMSAKGEKDGPDRVRQATVADRHVEDRFGRMSDVVPDPQPRQHAPPAGRHREGTPPMA